MSIEISIVIPLYNVEKYIRECLDSILNQTFQDFEIICVNDGSTDGTGLILEDYQKKDSRIIVINKKKEGASSARNFGLSKARGKYVHFLDSDDYFEPNMLEKMYSLAENNDAEITICSARKVNELGEITESKNPNFPINIDALPIKKVFNYKDNLTDFFSMLGAIVWNKLYLRDFLISNSLQFPNLVESEDLFFSCASGVCASRVVALDDEFINYRFNREGSIQSYRADYASDVIKSALLLKEFLEQRSLFDEFKFAWLNTYTSSFRWEVALCGDEQYKNFVEQLKTLMPDDWELFEPALRDSITMEKIYKFIGNRKVMFWGASYYLRNLLEKEQESNPDILGIIDRNTASWGKMCKNYKIYPPESIKELKPEGILLTVHNNHETIYKSLKEELAKNYPFVELLPNIFEEKQCIKK